MKKVTPFLIILFLGCIFETQAQDFIVNGNLGIGTNNPLSSIHIEKAVPRIRMVDTDFNTISFIQETGNGFLFSADIQMAKPNSGMIFRIHNNEVLRINSNGRVGIGTNNPQTAFHLESNIPRIRLHDTDNGSFSQIEENGAGLLINADVQGNKPNSKIAFRVSSSEKMRLQSDGFLGLGTMSPATLLEVNGDASKPGGGMWSVASDKRLKKNVKPYDGGLKEVLAFNPVSFQYNGKGGITDTESTYVGLIAQEAKEVAEHMVSSVKRGEVEIIKNTEEDEIEVINYNDYLMVDPSSISFMLINAVKEQQAQIEENAKLQKKVETLEAKLNALLQLIDAGNDFENIEISQDISLKIEPLAVIGQNVPNPYNTQTQITYQIPESARNARIQFYDNLGRLIKSENISSFGKGVLNIKNEDLPAGNYTYSLIVDNKVVMSKKMIVR